MRTLAAPHVRTSHSADSHCPPRGIHARASVEAQAIFASHSRTQPRNRHPRNMDGAVEHLQQQLARSCGLSGCTERTGPCGGTHPTMAATHTAKQAQPCANHQACPSVNSVGCQVELQGGALPARGTSTPSTVLTPSEAFSPATASEYASSEADECNGMGAGSSRACSSTEAGGHVAEPQSEPILMDNPGRYTMFPIRHQRIWELYKRAEASFWVAEEVDLAADKADWERLSGTCMHRGRSLRWLRGEACAGALSRGRVASQPPCVA